MTCLTTEVIACVCLINDYPNKRKTAPDFKTFKMTTYFIWTTTIMSVMVMSLCGPLKGKGTKICMAPHRENLTPKALILVFAS